MSFACISFDIVEYDGSLLAPEDKETAPILMVWTSLQNRQKTYFPITWLKNSNRTKAAPFTATAIFSLDERNYDEKNRTVKIRLGDSLGLCVKVHTPNPQGQLSIQDCGDVLVPLGQMLAEALRVAKNDVAKANSLLKEREIVESLKYHVYTEEDGKRVNKGAIVITNLRALLMRDPAAAKPAAFGVGNALLLDLEREKGEVKIASEFDYVAANESFFSAATNNVLMRSIYPFTEHAMSEGLGFAAASEEVRRAHAAVFSVASGTLPAFMFAVKPGPQAPVKADSPVQFTLSQAWLRKLGDYALARINQSPEWFIGTVTRQLAVSGTTEYDAQFTACANLIGQVAAMGPTSMPYVSDEVHTSARNRIARVKTRNGYVNFEPSKAKEDLHAVERFSEMIDNDGGDCEDGGMFAYRVLTMLQHGEWEDSLVSAMSRVARLYVPAVELTTVEDPSIENDLSKKNKLGGSEIIDSAADRAKKIGAHMYCEALPVPKFAAMVQRAVPDFNPALVAPPGYVGEPWHAAVPHLVIEATGRIESLQQARVAYVFGSEAEKRAAVAEAQERHALISALVSNKDETFSRMQMVREQPDTTLTPNKRVTDFYRDATHLFTGAVLHAGGSVLDFTHAHRGDRVPAPESIGTLDLANPIALAMRAPGTAATVAVTPISAPAPAAVEPVNMAEWSKGAAFHGDAKLVPAKLDGLGVAMSLMSHGTLEPPAAAAASLLSVAGSALGEGGGGGGGAVIKPFKYGVPLYDRLSAPLLPAACLVPGTQLSARELRYMGELMRQMPPINMPGDWRQVEMMHDAALTSRLVNNGDDERANMKIEDAHVAQLQENLRLAMCTEKGRDWPKRGSHTGKWHLATFFFPFAALRDPAAITAVTRDVTRHFLDGRISFARLNTEEAVPYRRFAVLQLMLNPPQAQAAAAIAAQQKNNARTARSI